MVYHQFRGDGQCSCSDRGIPCVEASSADAQDALNVDFVPQYFAAYPWFDFDPENDAIVELRRLSMLLGFDPDDDNDPLVRQFRRGLRTALLRQANARRGALGSEESQEAERASVTKLLAILARRMSLGSTDRHGATDVAAWGETAEAAASQARSVDSFKHGNYSEPTRSTFSHPSPLVDHISTYFATYTQFRYNPRRDAISEWRRLCVQLGNNPDDANNAAVRRSRYGLSTALVRQFNARYGEDAERLEAWQNLCRDVGIPVPTTLHEARGAIRTTHINLIDHFVLRSFASAEIYATEIELSAYTKRTKKFFPSSHIESGDLLRELLRQIHRPRPEADVRAAAAESSRHGRRRHLL